MISILFNFSLFNFNFIKIKKNFLDIYLSSNCIKIELKDKKKYILTFLNIIS